MIFSKICVKSGIISKKKGKIYFTISEKKKNKKNDFLRKKTQPDNFIL